MKNHLFTSSLIVISILSTQCKSGLVTTSNGCYNLINTAKDQNRAGNYSGALDNFNTVLKKCDAYDAKEPAYAGKAEALNGLRQYNDALDAANAGLKISSTSIDNLFQRASAEMGMGMTDNAKTDLNQVIALTQKNRNTQQVANIYAKIAEVETRQGLYSDAMNHIGQAMSKDPGNLNFYLQRGDINAAAGNYSAALGSYDEAISRGKDDGETWKAKTTTTVKMYQQKYGTDNADQLRKKMSGSERQTLCNTIQTGQSKGMRDMTIDMVQAAICK